MRKVSRNSPKKFPSTPLKRNWTCPGAGKTLLSSSARSRSANQSNCWCCAKPSRASCFPTEKLAAPPNTATTRFAPPRRSMTSSLRLSAPTKPQRLFPSAPDSPHRLICPCLERALPPPLYCSRRRKGSGDLPGLQSRRFGPSRVEWWVRLPHASAISHIPKVISFAEQMARPVAFGFERLLFFCFLRDDVHIHGGRLAQEAMHRREIEIFPPVMHGSPPEDYLRDVLRAHKFSNRIRDAFPLQLNHFGSQAFRESQIGRKRFRIRLLRAKLPVHVHHVQFGVHAPRHSRAPGNQILPRGIRGNAHRHALPHAPVFSDVLRLHVRLEAAIHLFRHLAQSQLAQRD